MILLLIYILTIFFGKNYFSIIQLGIFFSILGFIWLLVGLNKFSLKKIIQPVVLIAIGLISIGTESYLILKGFPLVVSLFFFIAFIHAQITKNYFLIKYIQKFKKLDKLEIDYLIKTHIVWIVITFINVLLHTYFLFMGSLKEWAFYTTVGWYILLGCGILFQIIFRRF